VVATISKREKDCLVWTAQGKRSWEIGKILGISEHTVNFHLKDAYRKLDVSVRSAAVVKAGRLGLLGPPAGERAPAQVGRPATLERIRTPSEAMRTEFATWKGLHKPACPNADHFSRPRIKAT
jgi:LuxR family quorum-sensing system transcriptional regulator CciR